MKKSRKTAFTSLKQFSGKHLWRWLDAAPDGAEAQRKVLLQLSHELIGMTERLLVEIEVDRDAARSLIAEFTGLLEKATNAASILLDFDEYFGGTKSRRPRLAVLAKKLELSLCYLSGVLSAIHVSDELSYLDWLNVKADIDSVWKISRSIVSMDMAGENSKLAK
ncbi:MAG: hypothetical protein KDB27_19830 [Planctomycetales bacterium]|nr:hypothetical protein [Planctomycetales bacterium]